MLSVALSFGSELLLWNDLQAKTVIDWLILIFGMLILGTLILDLLIRLRLRDLPGLMTLAGLYALLYAFVINPQSTLFDLPRTLVTRVTGAHALIALEMLIFIVALMSGDRGLFRRVTWIGAVIVGLAWGTWLRWSPFLEGDTPVTISGQAMLLAGVVGGLMIALLSGQLVRHGSRLEAEDVVLTRNEWFAILIVLLLLMMVRLAQGVLSPTALLIVVILIVLCYAMLWFRRSTRLAPFSEFIFPPQSLNTVWYIVLIALFLFVAILAYDAPELRVGEFTQLSVIVYGFTLYGIAWLPTVSLWLGMRAYLRQISVRPQ